MKVMAHDGACYRLWTNAVTSKADSHASHLHIQHAQQPTAKVVLCYNEE